MRDNRLRIAVVAPAARISDEIAARVGALAAQLYPQRLAELFFHPQCFLTSGHFAGDDTARGDAFIAVANDPHFDAVWIGRGGYGSCRIAEAVIEQLATPARDKLYMGYSDAGNLLAALYRNGCRVAHGPMPADILRPGGEAAVARGLAYLIERAPSALEPHVAAGAKAAAFNLTILSQMLGTPIEPDLTDHVLMLEEECEHMYRIDRYFFHITSNPAIRRVAGIRLGRCSNIPANVPDFAQTEEEVARTWCARAGIAYLGRADIGHDIDNKVVPFGDGHAA